MRLLSHFSVAFLFITAAAGGASAQSLQDFKECIKITEDARRLGCFDAASKGLTALTAAKPATLSDSEAALQQETARLRLETAVLKKEAQQLKAEKLALENEKKTVERKADQLAKVVKETKPKNTVIPEGVITKVTKRQFGRLRVHLDNGQVWGQAENGFARHVKVGATVQLKKKSLGSYILKVKGKSGAIKVKRKL